MSPTGCPPVGPSTMRAYVSGSPGTRCLVLQELLQEEMVISGFVGQLTRALGTPGMEVPWEAVTAPPWDSC